MYAKQILRSASLAVVLGASVLARAEPGAPAPADDAAHPDPPSKSQRKRATGTFSIGAGYSTDDGFVARASISQSNLFGSGKLLALDALVSARRQLAVLRFVDPDVAGSGAALGAQLYNDRRELPGFAREAVGGAVTLSHALGDHVVAFATYRLEHVAVEAPLALARGDVGAPEWRGGLVASLRSGLAYSTVDAPVLPQHGSTAGVALESASAWLGSSLELARLDAWAATHQLVGPFIVHVAAAFHGVSADAPRSERIFLDGSSQLRGYAPGAIAPLGGTLEWLGSVDVELPIVRRLGLAAETFEDGGAIVDARGRLAIGRSYGFGMVWRSPIGPLRADYAFPLVGPPRFVFGAGAW